MRLDFSHIPPFYERAPRAVNMIVETPRNSRQKYAVKPEYGVMELRRILRGGMVWPCDFGFVPGTLADDGDALDVALLIEEPTFPGVLVRARLLGVIGLVKNGQENDRLLACPVSLPGSASIWDEVHDLPDISPRLVREIEAFLKDYQTFEGNTIELTGIHGADEAYKRVQIAAELFKSQNG